MVDQQLFRRVMGKFATGVTVIAAQDTNGVLWGLTANAFTSVSLDPPLVLVCIDKRAGCYDALREADYFSVNFLADHQEQVSQLFASKGENRFAQVEWKAGVTGAPVLSGTLGVVECSRYEVLPGGDHIILLGKVEHLTCKDGEPLLYFAGMYRKLQPIEISF
ncbi:MAG: flavin reductase family protein [Blastocatellia bacterium]